MSSIRFIVHLGNHVTRIASITCGPADKPSQKRTKKPFAYVHLSGVQLTQDEDQRIANQGDDLIDP